MTLGPDESAWLEDNMFVPRAGRIWPWVLTALFLFGTGLSLLIPTKDEAAPAMSVIHPPRPAAVEPGPAQVKGQWTLGCVDSKESSFAIVATEMAEDVKKRTEGRVQIKVAPVYANGGKALDELGLTHAVKSGELQMAIVTSSPLTNVSPDFEVLDLPFLFKSYEHADHVMLGEIGTKIMQSLRTSGIIGLASLEVGFRIIGSSVPMPTLADFKDKKVRVMQSTTAIAMVRLLGSEAIPSPVTKIYEMAQKRYIDAADRTYPTYWDFKLNEVLRHVTESRHSYSVKIVIVNGPIFEQMSAADQLVVQSAALAIQTRQRQLQRQEDARVKARCRKQGIPIYELSESERQRFIDACRPLYEEYVKLRGPKLLDAIRQQS